jgi:hypothetical protein
MFNHFEKKKHFLEEDTDNNEPFDHRIKQIEAIRKNRLIQLEKVKQEAQTKLDESKDKLNENRMQSCYEALFYALLEPMLEQKFLFLDANVRGLTHWVDEIKELRQNITNVYNKHYEFIQDYLAKKQSFETAKKEAHDMLIQTEKLALLETMWIENGGNI